jgi:Amt family ammonium transporter
VLPWHGLVIGAVAGAVCYWFCTVVKHYFKYDDSLDVFGVHGIGGIIGTLLAGVFATAALSVGPDAPNGIAGLLEGNPRQLGLQAIGVVVTIVWCAVGTWITLKIVSGVCSLRVSADEEREGLDLSQHGEALHQ